MTILTVGRSPRACLAGSGRVVRAGRGRVDAPIGGHVLSGRMPARSSCWVREEEAVDPADEVERSRQRMISRLERPSAVRRST